MKYLKKFENAAAYAAAKSDLVLPNLSIIAGQGNFYCNPIQDSDSADYVEIAGIKWAKKNIGAQTITDVGYFFQWADTQGYTQQQITNNEKQFDWEHYVYTETQTDDSTSTSGDSGSGDFLSKYNNGDGFTVLQPMDDAAKVILGGNWRIPSHTEFESLLQHTTYTWTDDYEGSGVAGVIHISKTNPSKKLFMPISDLYGHIACWCNDLDIGESVLHAYAYYDQNYNNVIYVNVSNSQRYMPGNIRAILDE